jgi:hypothetical protein
MSNRNTKKTKSKRIVKKLSLKEKIQDVEKSIQDRLNDVKYLVELERRYLSLEREHSDLKQKLVNLLLPEQIDAAKTCGVSPEFYALEWVDLCKDKLRTYTPGFGDNIKSFNDAVMRRG